MIRPIQNCTVSMLLNSNAFGKPAKIAPSTDSISPETSCFFSIWEWVKEHVFCCFFTKIEEVFSKENISTTETVDTCPIPILTEGPLEDRELNHLIRELYSWGSEKHPEHNPYISEVAKTLQEVYLKIENNEAEGLECFQDIELDWIYHSRAMEDFLSIVSPKLSDDEVDELAATITRQVRLLRLIYQRQYP